MNTTMKGMEYYETEGMRLMDAGMDAQARSCFVKAAELGSGRAKVFLQYLDMNVSDEDFRDHPVKAEPFDYDLQRLFRVSCAASVLKKAFMNIRNHTEAVADGIAWGIHTAISGKPATNVFPG